jgi:putative endonuclease
MSNKKKEKTFLLGKLGEHVACRYLMKKGYVIKEMNYVNKHGYRRGEIDIIAQKDDEIIFVEVKTRVMLDEKLIFPEERITAFKLKRMERAAESYLFSQNLLGSAYRFDALLICYNPSLKQASVQHREHIFL